MKYRTIYIDPPWPEIGGGVIKRGADRHYNVMSVADIVALPIKQLADQEGAHLYLWATNNHLNSAFRCLDAWGFEYITTITWFKNGKIGLGQYYRGRTEHCLFASTTKKLPYKIIDGIRQQGVTGFMAARREHSTKPEEMRTMIENVSYAPRIEIFARRRYPFWDAAGDGIGIPLAQVFGQADETPVADILAIDDCIKQKQEHFIYRDLFSESYN